MEQDFMKYKICTSRDLRFIQMLEAEYSNTSISLKELSKKYHTDAYHQFKLYGIPKRTKNEQRMLTRKGCIQLNWDGSSIENEKQAYVAGLFLADGFIGNTQAGLRLKRTDRELLQKVKNCFSEEIKLQEETSSCSFVVSSKKVCINLSNLGIFKGKTSKELPIPPMNNDLIRHFIRGFFDGDGSVFLNHNGKYTSIRCNICSPTKSILEQINNVLLNNGISGTINKENRKGKYTTFGENNRVLCSTDMYRLFIRSKKSVEQFYHFLYDQCSIYLERKRKVFEDNMSAFIYQKPRKVYANTELTNQIAQG